MGSGKAVAAAQLDRIERFADKEHVIKAVGRQVHPALCAQMSMRAGQTKRARQQIAGKAALPAHRHHRADCSAAVGG